MIEYLTTILYRIIISWELKKGMEKSFFNTTFVYKFEAKPNYKEAEKVLGPQPWERMKNIRKTEIVGFKAIKTRKKKVTFVQFSN